MHFDTFIALFKILYILRKLQLLQLYFFILIAFMTIFLIAFITIIILKYSTR